MNDMQRILMALKQVSNDLRQIQRSGPQPRRLVVRMPKTPSRWQYDWDLPAEKPAMPQRTIRRFLVDDRPTK